MKAVLLTPMQDGYEPVRKTVELGLSESSITPIRLDHPLRAGAVWSRAIADAIQEADLIVADVSERNPNVLYELGFADALRKPTLLLLSTSAEGPLPFDVAGYHVVTYDPTDMRALRRQVHRFASYQQERHRPRPRLAGMRPGHYAPTTDDAAEALLERKERPRQRLAGVRRGHYAPTTDDAAEALLERKGRR